MGWFRGRDEGWLIAYRFWTKVFALSFALGVASGITMSFQFGTTMSAFWILSLNSWMQTPAGHEIINGEFHVKDWFELVFNPSFPYRLAPMLLASGLTASFLMAGVCGWQLVRGTANRSTGRSLRLGLTVAALLLLFALPDEAARTNRFEIAIPKLASLILT